MAQTIVVKPVALWLLTVLIVFTVASASEQKKSGGGSVQSLKIGSAMLNLGEDKDTVLRRMQTLFDVKKASELGADEWLILRKGQHPPYEPVGTVSFSADKLVFASKILADTNSAEVVVQKLHAAFASLSDVPCRLKSSSHTVDKKSSQDMTAVEFRCGRSAEVSVLSTRLSGQKPTVTVVQSVRTFSSPAKHTSQESSLSTR